MSSLKLWLIRHGESSINAGIWSIDPANAQLTVIGKEQAHAVATTITEVPDLIISSPLTRAKESAHYIIKNWPQAPNVLWPIQELMYLSPAKMSPLSPEERKAQIDDYWQKCDPLYCDGEGAESFAAFLARVSQFHSKIVKQRGFVVVVGHGLFFQAFQLGLIHGFHPTTDWIHLFHQQELTQPIKNSELLKITITANYLT